MYLLLAFEGPDPASRVGGLATREIGLAEALAASGEETALAFLGDPDEPPEAVRNGVHLHRLLPELQRRYPGPYEAEASKVQALAASFPEWALETFVRPAAAEGKRVILLAEEWQTVPAVIRLSDLAHERGMRHALTLVWNANNPFGFETIDWARLDFVAHLTTVSRWMKEQIRQHSGLSAVVIPNGLGDDAFQPASDEAVADLRDAMAAPFWAKIGRYDPDKRWEMALSALAHARTAGRGVRLLVRGGREPYRQHLRAMARSLSLGWGEVRYGPDWPGPLRATTAPVVEVVNFLPDPAVRAIYRGAEAVLANSRREPFGLVGLEVMAAGGVAVVGSTGEDYARAYHNALVVETEDPREIPHHLSYLAHPGTRDALIQHGRATAEDYRWPNVLKVLQHFIDYFCDLHAF